MRKLYLFIIICIIILGLGFFFAPKPGCGFNSTSFPFEKYRCACFGLIGRDNQQSPVDGGKIDYSCYGIKIGEAKLVSETTTNNDKFK